MNKEELKIGALIIKHTSMSEPQLLKITGETNTMWLVGDSRYRKETLHKVPHQPYSQCYIEIPTEEDVIHLRKLKLINDITTAIKTADMDFADYFYIKNYILGKALTTTVK